MISFWLIAILVALVVFLAFKMNNIRTKTAYIFIFLGVSFLLLTGFLVFSGKEVNLTTIEGATSAIKTYVSWIGNAGSNVIKISSYVLKQEWKENDIINSTG